MLHDTVTVWPSSRCGSRRAARHLRATRSPSKPSRRFATITANSSPLSRATVSSARTIPRSHRLQQQVADCVPESIVHALQAIDVDVQDAEALVVARGAGEQLRQPIV